MRKWKAVCILVLAALLLMLPALSACATAADTAVIDGMDASRVHLRQEASQAAASLGLFFTGTEVTLLDTSNEEWAQVEIGSQRGYMMKKYLRIGADPRLATNRQPLGVPGNSNEEAPVWFTLPPTGQPDGNLTQAAVLTILGETADGYYYAQAANLHFYVSSDAVWITGEDAMPAVRASQLLGQVVADYLPYLDAMSGQELLLSQYNPYVDGLTYRIGRYAIADLDRDGVQEVAVEVRVEEYPISN
ncbi:MAG: SH3 domain-containing protein, partial [Clostridia bacterium]|nr:SH3 domain-containing protein [Clostridia bacterium]